MPIVFVVIFVIAVIVANRVVEDQRRSPPVSVGENSRDADCATACAQLKQRRLEKCAAAGLAASASGRAQSLFRDFLAAQAVAIALGAAAAAAAATVLGVVVAAVLAVAAGVAETIALGIFAAYTSASDNERARLTDLERAHRAEADATAIVSARCPAGDAAACFAQLPPCS